jgi:hypothetical protein
MLEMASNALDATKKRASGTTCNASREVSEPNFILKSEQPVQSMFSSFRLLSPKMASGNNLPDSRPSGLNATLSAHKPVSFDRESGRLVK